MNKQTKTEIRQAMTELLNHKHPWVRIHAGLILCAIDNLYVSETPTATIDASGKLTAQLNMAKQEVLNRMQRRKDTRRRANRAYYLKQQIRELEAQQEQYKEATDNEYT